MEGAIAARWEMLDSDEKKTVLKNLTKLLEELSDGVFW